MAKTPLYCVDCGTEIFADVNMVMLKDLLWRDVIEMDFDWEDSLCDKCIEKRLGRPITPDDFKSNLILCNHYWLHEQQNKRNEK